MSLNKRIRKRFNVNLRVFDPVVLAIVEQLVGAWAMPDQAAQIGATLSMVWLSAPDPGDVDYGRNIHLSVTLQQGHGHVTILSRTRNGQSSAELQRHWACVGTPELQDLCHLVGLLPPAYRASSTTVQVIGGGSDANP